MIIFETIISKKMRQKKTKFERNKLPYLLSLNFILCDVINRNYICLFLLVFDFENEWHDVYFVYSTFQSVKHVKFVTWLDLNWLLQNSRFICEPREYCNIRMCLYTSVKKRRILTSMIKKTSGCALGHLNHLCQYPPFLNLGIQTHILM